MWKMLRRLKSSICCLFLTSVSTFHMILFYSAFLHSKVGNTFHASCSAVLCLRWEIGNTFYTFLALYTAHSDGSYLPQLSGIKLSGKALNWYIILMAAFPFAICHLLLCIVMCVHTRHSTTTLHWIAVCGTHFITFRARLSELRWLSNSNWRYLSTPHNVNFPPAPPDFRWL